MGGPSWTCSKSACWIEHSRAVPCAEKMGARSASFYQDGNVPADDRPQYGGRHDLIHQKCGRARNLALSVTSAFVSVSSALIAFESAPPAGGPSPATRPVCALQRGSTPTRGGVGVGRQGRSPPAPAALRGELSGGVPGARGRGEKSAFIISIRRRRGY